MTGADALIASLEQEGVDLIFGYPGGQVLAIYDALYRRGTIDHVLARHEQGAVHMADGFARATGKVGVVLVTSGPGATNTVTGIATAYMDSVPLVVITGQVPRSVIGTDSFQESDIFGITLPIVKHSYLVSAAADLPRIVKEAFHIASTGRPGPVLIDIPSDVAAAEVDFAWPEALDIPGYKPTVKGNARQIKQAVAKIAESTRPVLYVGGGAVSSGAAEGVRAFSHEYRIPVVHTLMGIGAVPTEDDLNIGMVGMHGGHAGRLALQASDLIIAVGARFSDRVIGDAAAFAPQASVIHIDIDPAEIGKIRTADVPIVGDLPRVLEDLMAYLAREGVRPNTDAWVREVKAWKATNPVSVPAAADGVGVSPAAVLELINQHLDPEHSIITTEVGQHQMWAAQFLTRTEPRTFLTSGGLGTMGFGFPAAIGAQFGRPDCTVVCIAGDGSLVMNAQEMATAAARSVPVKVVVFNNRCLGMVHQWQKMMLEGRFAYTELENTPDFLKLADAYDWRSARILCDEDLIAGVDEMFAADGPFLLEAVISRDVDVTPFAVHGEYVEGAEQAHNADDSEGAAGAPSAMTAADAAQYLQDLQARLTRKEIGE